METAVIGDEATGSRRRHWFGGIILFAALVFVILLAYLLVVTLLSSRDDESSPVTGDDGSVEDGVTTAGLEAPGDRPVTVFSLGADDLEHVDVRCLLPTRFTPVLIELTNASSITTTIEVHLVIADGTGRAFETVAAAADLRPGEIREVLPRVKAAQPVRLAGGVSRCDILAVQQEWRVVRYGAIELDSR